jgi:hypothetical protein
MCCTSQHVRHFRYMCALCFVYPRAHCAHASLREIWNSSQTFLVEPTPEQILTYSVGGDILQPLLSFSNLHKLDLRHPVGFDIDNATILDMARSWPQLKILNLVACTTRHMPSRVTLEGLYTFAEHCPQLTGLTLTFDATLPPCTAPSDQPRHSQQRLEYLNVEGSPVGAPAPVAEFLFFIFPNLWVIRTEQRCFADGAWKPVSAMFKDLRDGAVSDSGKLLFNPIWQDHSDHTFSTCDDMTHPQSRFRSRSVIGEVQSFSLQQVWFLVQKVCAVS